MVQVYKESSVLDEFWMLKFGMGSKREWDTQGNTRLWMAANWTSGVAAMTRRMTLTISLCGLCMFSFRFSGYSWREGPGRCWRSRGHSKLHIELGRKRVILN